MMRSDTEEAFANLSPAARRLVEAELDKQGVEAPAPDAIRPRVLEAVLPRSLEAVRPRKQVPVPAEPLVPPVPVPAEPLVPQEEAVPETSTSPTSAPVPGPIFAALTVLIVSSKLSGLFAPKPEPMLPVGPVLLGLAVFSAAVVVLDKMPPVPELPPELKEALSKVQENAKSSLAKRAAEAEARWTQNQY